ncbi:Ref family protein [Caballeronia sp. SEWSISQ10-4 2]|uniref:Ref family recombination enhancement nuclease n=1 Tax=Caballeronia sp. SEWSISQ10-4 2 TaxID=2937438 RepID=UPI00264F4860|nr:Ref family recombination enhancement nuclease [Caballeronia sp. SEWSISQ10-4 2]MDN7179065.1 Ref family protein [Caballeronia sp. SEWSISQ10-4 2]
MKRSGFKPRTAPMARGNTQLARSSFKPGGTAKPRKTSPPKVKATPRPRIVTSAVEEYHRDRVAQLGCVVCRNLRLGKSPAELHHARTYAGGGQKSSEFHVLPICPNHHRLGGAGVALHAGRQTWAKLYGTEESLLLQVLHALGFEIEPDDLWRPDLGAILYPTGIPLK